MTVVHLRVNHTEKPFIDKTPEFSWRIESDENDVLQTAYQISVKDDKGEVWNSGKVISRKQSFVKYDGTLSPKTIYTFSVSVWDNKGNFAVSDSSFETALLSPDEWQADFVKSPFKRNTVELFKYGTSNPAVYMERRFKVLGDVACARLYATAYGVYKPTFNGIFFGGEFAPEYTPYNSILNYQCYDVTDKISIGNNTLSFLIGDGWFFCPQTEIPTDEKIDNLSVLYRLDIKYKDGTTECFCSDGSELCRESNIVFSDLFMGERADMTIPLGEEKASCVTNLSKNKLRVQPMPQVKVVEEIPTQKIYTSPKGETIVDFGQVIAGRCRIKINEPVGTEIKIEHTEITDKDGNFYDVMEFVKQTDVYISDGIIRVYEPTFTFHGFRYIRVSGITSPKKEDFTAVLLSTEKENTGTFECSDKRFERLYKNIRYSQRNNMLSIPTDCPSREKAGWTGDILIYAKTAMQNEEMTPFLTSWLSGLAANQKADGVVPFTSPLSKHYDGLAKRSMKLFGDNEHTGIAGWSDAIVWVPYDMYKMTGNLDILNNHYEGMKRWCDYIIRTAEEKRGSELPYETDRYLWNTGFHFGEWLVPGRKEEGLDVCTETSCYTTPFFGYMTLKKMSEIARITGNSDCERYTEYAAKFKNAIQNGLMKSDILPDFLQGLYVLAIAFDLVPEELKITYSERLVKLIENSGCCLGTGFLATPYLLDSLIKTGRKDLAAEVLWQNKRPSWLFEIESGATAIWESWFALDEEKNPKNISFDHYAFGVIDDFIFRRVAGIKKTDMINGHFIIEPETDLGFTSCNRTFTSELGVLSVEWSKSELRVKIPCNATASVIWNGKTSQIGSGTYKFK